MSAVTILNDTILLVNSFPYTVTRKPSMCANAKNKQWGNLMSADVTIGCTLHGTPQFTIIIMVQAFQYHFQKSVTNNIHKTYY